MTNNTPIAATEGGLLPREGVLGYHNMGSRGRCDFTHLREAVAEATSGSRTHATPFDPDLSPGHQIVSALNFNSLDRIVTAFVDGAIATRTPAPSLGEDVVRDMARKLYAADTRITNEFRPEADRLDFNGRDLEGAWFDQNASMPLSGPGFIARWEALARAALSSMRPVQEEGVGE